MVVCAVIDVGVAAVALEACAAAIAEVAVHAVDTAAAILARRRCTVVDVVTAVIAVVATITLAATAAGVAYPVAAARLVAGAKPAILVVAEEASLHITQLAVSPCCMVLTLLTDTSRWVAQRTVATAIARCAIRPVMPTAAHAAVLALPAHAATRAHPSGDITTV